MPGHQEFQYQVNVLGPIAVVAPQGGVDPGGTKPRLLLALLVANAGAMVTTERLIDGLWGDDPPPTARKTVHVHVSNLRRSLGAGFPLQTTRAGYRLDRELVDIDAIRFETGLARGRALLEPSPAEAADVLATALQLWSGSAYAEVADQEGIRPEALRLTELRLTAIEHRIEADLAVGRHAALLGELETLTIDNPFRERLSELQLLALYRSGRQADALRTYERTRRTLAEELGLDPGPGLRDLHRRILEQSQDLELVAGWSRPATTSVGAGVGDGRTIRGYEIRERLGGRGEQCVYRAYQGALGREVALRFIPPVEANQPEFVKNFDTACHTVADLKHPHIAGIHDFWRDPDGAVVVMPLIRGGTLERSLERSLWRAPAALRLLDQIGSALAFAHRRGIAHGDVRTSNVLLDEDGTGYLSDFVMNGRSTRVRDGDARFSVACDIEGLARVTCEMLTGAPPSETGFTRAELPAGFADLMRIATHSDPVRRFERVEDYLRSLRQCFGADSVSTLDPQPHSDTRNPFKGLRAFRESDAGDFFGRDELVREIIERVSNRGLSAVVGPSGSGKSSLVRAGLMPACRRRGLVNGRDLVIAEMLPGRYPFEELASALMSVAVDRPEGLLAELGADENGLLRAAKRILPDDDTDLLLIVDQFEELFALTPEESVRQSFLANLCAVARDERHRVRVVVTLRADFFDRPLLYPDFGEIMKQSITTVALPGESSLAEAIAEPARRVGLEIEPGLIPTILRDVADQPGSLPMLQYALTELVEARDGNVLTIAAYRRTGGVVGALATRAEEIFASLSPAARHVAPEVFVRLVTLGDETDDTRRRVRRTELEALGVDAVTLEAVIDAFGAFRLLTFDHDPITRGPTVEVAHEALIREWPRFREWVDSRRDELRAERRLASTTAEWIASDQDASFLIGGVQLARYESWVDEPPVRLTADEREFIDASVSEERIRQERTTRRRRSVLIGAALLSGMALIAAVIALIQRERASDQARVATESAAVADSLRAEAEVAARRDRIEANVSGAAAQADPDRELLLALASFDQLRADGLTGPNVTSALYNATYDQRIAARIPVAEHPAVERPVQVAASSDGTRFVTGRIGGAQSIVDVATGEVVTTLQSPVSDVVASAWNGADEPLMTGRYDGVIDLWQPDGQHLESISVSDKPVWPLLVRDQLLAYGKLPSALFANYSGQGPGNFTVVVEDRATGEKVFESTSEVRKAAVSPSRQAIALIENEQLALYDTASWVDVTPPRLLDQLESSSVLDLAWAAEQADLWVLTRGHVTRFDVTTGDELKALDIDPGNNAFVVPSPDGRLLALGGYGTSVHVIDARSGNQLTDLVASNYDGTSPLHRPFGIAWVGDRRLAVANDDSTLLWNLAEPMAVTSFWPGVAMLPAAAAMTASGDRVLMGGGGSVNVFDQDGRLRFSRPAAGETDAPALLSADGAVLAAPGADAVEFVDVASGDVLTEGPVGLSQPLGLSRDGRFAVLGTSPSVENSVLQRVWIVDTATGEHVSLGGAITGAGSAFTSDDRLAVIPTVTIIPNANTVLEQTRLRVVDIATGTTIAVNQMIPCVHDVAVSHDDTRLAVLGCGGEVALFDLTTAGKGSWTGETALIATNAEDPTPGLGVTFAEDDDTIIVARQDGRVEAFDTSRDVTLLWSWDVGDHVGVPQVYEDMVFVGTAYELEEGSLSGGIVGMPLDPDNLVETASARATRPLTTTECKQFLVDVTC